MDVSRFFSFIFLKSLWVFDLCVYSVFGGWLGYSIQLETSSDLDYRSDFLVLGAAVGIFSFLIAGAVGMLFNRNHLITTSESISISSTSGPSRIVWRPPSWVWLTSIGSMLFALGHGVILVAWKSVDPNSTVTTAEQIISKIFVLPMVGKLFTGLFLFGSIFLVVLLVARLLAFLVYRSYFHLAKRASNREIP